ncbi:MAG: hypothetical protein ACJ76X_02475 [Solirubrobacteraceae bacterium]
MASGCRRRRGIATVRWRIREVVLVYLHVEMPSHLGFYDGVDPLMADLLRALRKSS